MLYRVVENDGLWQPDDRQRLPPVQTDGSSRGTASRLRRAGRPDLRDATTVAQGSSGPSGATGPGGDRRGRRRLEAVRARTGDRPADPAARGRTDALVRIAEGLARFAERWRRTADQDVARGRGSGKPRGKLAADAEHETRPRRARAPRRARPPLAERDRLLAERRHGAKRPACEQPRHQHVPRRRRAVASIPLDDPRAILTGVLIDNLISVGRFDDARATTVLYPDTPARMVALGAIAESQGRRGLAESARDWIARDVPRRTSSPSCCRRVINGDLVGHRAEPQPRPESRPMSSRPAIGDRLRVRARPVPDSKRDGLTPWSGRTPSSVP